MRPLPTTRLSPRETETTAPRSGAVRIGCAGWSIPSVHAEKFGAGSSQLARYASRFGCVEINSSFYRPHRFETYSRWAATVPHDFRFSVKLPKAITHEARLRATTRLVAQFAAEVAGLGDKLGGLLIQLPPSLIFESRVANSFFTMLRRHIDVPFACEPRHTSWFDPEIEAFWIRHAIARVAADPARPAQARIPGNHGPCTYWRWHGSPQMYCSRYDDAQLRALAESLRANARPRRSAWCLFDNTAAGHAITDALRLHAIMNDAANGGA